MRALLLTITVFLASLFLLGSAWAVTPDHEFSSPYSFNDAIGFKLYKIDIDSEYQQITCWVQYIDSTNDYIGLGLPQNIFPRKVVLTGDDYNTVMDYTFKAGDVGVAFKTLLNTKLVNFLKNKIVPQ